ncbi:MAG: DUF3685 domain-containing protein [Cyanobacteriota bacterium]
MSDRQTKLLLVDDDPIFRLGLSTALANFSDLQVVGQVDTAVAALEQLTKLSANEFPDIVVLDWYLGRFSGKQTSGLQLCQQLKSLYPKLPLFLLTTEMNPDSLATARMYGVIGYCPKGTAIAQIVTALREVAAGKFYWRTGESKNLPSPTRPNFPTGSIPPKFLSRMRQSGLAQIDAALAQVNAQLQNSRLSTLDWLFWTGRRRELVAARWMVQQLLPVEVIFLPESSNGVKKEIPGEQRLTQSNTSLPSPSLPVPATPELPVPGRLFETALSKIQSGVENLTGSPLEIDILQPAKKQELLYLVLQQFRQELEELRFLKLSPEQLAERRSQLLRNLWQSSTIDFFLKYYDPSPQTRSYQIVDVVVQYSSIVQRAVLDEIPFVAELIAYLLFDKPLVINNFPYTSDSPEAMARAEMLLENLVLQVANASMQVLLNYFAEVEAIKYSLYQSRFLSSREVAQFRNTLSWKYRREYYIDQPKAIFESRYRLLILNGYGIRQISIYSPRNTDLDELMGVRWWLTIALEARDAIAPLLRGAVSVIGNAAIYVLTRVIGRGIGLIVRGVIQGIGSTLQDVRYGKDGDRK